MRRQSRWVWGTAAAVVLTAVVFGLDLTPWVRGGYGWRWEYDPLPLMRWVIPVILTVIYLGGAAVLLRRGAPMRALYVWSVLFGVALALSVTAAHEGDALYGLFSRTVSKLATGAHWLSAHVDWQNGEWREWTTVMRGAGGHLSNLPPGLSMAYAAVSGLFGTSPDAAQAVSGLLLPYQCHNLDLLSYQPEQVASAGFGVLMPVWAALAAFPLASITRRLSGEAAARWAVLWWPLTPALMAFAGSLNTIYPLFTLTAVYMLIRALDAAAARGKLGWAAASGLVSGLATFSNFAFAPLPLILGLFALTYGLGVRKHSLPGLMVLGAAFGTGALLPWFVFALATGLTPLDLLRASFEFHLDLERPYAFWTVMHVWDWLVWGGLGLTAFAVLSAATMRRRIDGGSALSAALVVGMLLLTLSGTARGETGRVWLVFTPLLVIAAADGLRRFSQADSRAWLVLSAASAGLALVLALSLPVVGTDLTPPPLLDTAPASQPVDATFRDDSGSLFRLSAWDAAQRGDTLELLLTFTAERRSSEPYYLGGVLVLPDQTTFPAAAQQPHDRSGGGVPATCWPPGTPVTVALSQPVPERGGVDGAYFSLALYGASAGAGPLQVEGPAGPDTQIGLGPFAIGEN